MNFILLAFSQNCDFFRTCRDDLQRKLCHLFKTEMYQPYTNIVNAGSIAQFRLSFNFRVNSCDFLVDSLA